MAVVAGQVTVEVKAQLDKLRRDLEKVRGQLQRVDRTGTRSMNRVSRATTRAGASARRAATSFRGMAAAIGTIGVGLALRAITRSVAEFQTSIAGVGAVTSGTTEQMAAMSAQARDLGKATIFSAGEAASGMEFLGRAGFEVSEIMDAMPGTLDLAAAGMLDLGRAADIASNVLQAFNLDAAEMGRVSDVLAAGAASSNTNIDQLAQGLSFVAPVAKSFGVALEDTVAAIGTLSNAGIQSTRAGTGLRTILVKLAAPTDDLAKFMGGLTLQGDGLNKVLEQLAGSSLSATEAMAIFGRRGGPAFNIMRDGTIATEELADALRKAEGESKRLAEERLGPMDRSFKQLKSAVQELVLVVGDSGLAKAMENLSNQMLAFARSDRAIAMAESFGRAVKFVADQIDPLIDGLRILIAMRIGAIFGFWGIAAGALIGVMFNLSTGTTAAQEAAELLRKSTEKLTEATEKEIPVIEEENRVLLETARVALKAAEAKVILKEAGGLAGFAGITTQEQKDVNTLLDTIRTAQNELTALNNRQAKREAGGGSDAKDAATEASKKHTAALTEEQQAVVDLISDLQFEGQLLNMNSAQQNVAIALREAGTAATAAQRAQITQLATAITAGNAAQGEALRLVESTRAPHEVLAKQLKGLKILYDAGAISAEQFGRASREAADKAGTSMLAGAGHVSNALGMITQATANGSKKAKQISKVTGIAQAIINTAVAATNALRNIPAPFNFAVAAATVVAGLAQVAQIRSQAMGGIVSGPGTGTSDSIPTMLSDGEFVINARDTGRNRGLLEMINKGANLQGLAAGGPIGGRSLSSPGIQAFGSSGGGKIIVEVVSRIDQEGNIQPFVERVSGAVAGQIVKATSPGIIERATNRTATKIARGGMDAPMGQRFGSQPEATSR